MRRYGTILVVALAALALAAPASAAKTSLVVDDDGANCPEAEYTTIQDAIDVAVAGDRIEVCDGAYFGAVVDKPVDLRARGAHVFIEDGPNTHSFLRAGFLFDADRSGSGATIQGFNFVGAQQFGYTDDGRLDFAVFSRGADDVTVTNNSMSEFLQGITTWDGSGWLIEKNDITDLWTLNGGGIGVFVGASDGGTHTGNRVEKNTVTGTLLVMPGDGGGYDGSAVVIYADFRYGRLGAADLSGNTIDKNTIEMVSNTPAVVNMNGIELTESSATPIGVVTGNQIEKNRIRGLSGNGILVTAAPGNVFEKNDIHGSGGFDIFDDTAGAGTAGTANTYHKNHCDTSSPGGLC